MVMLWMLSSSSVEIHIETKLGKYMIPLKIAKSRSDKWGTVGLEETMAGEGVLGHDGHTGIVVLEFSWLDVTKLILITNLGKDKRLHEMKKISKTTLISLQVIP